MPAALWVAQRTRNSSLRVNSSPTRSHSDLSKGLRPTVRQDRDDSACRTVPIDEELLGSWIQEV